MLDLNASAQPSPTLVNPLCDTYRTLRRAIQNELLELDGVESALACVVDSTMLVVVEGGRRDAIDAVVGAGLPEGIEPFVTHR